jgi:hypothetical protein
MKIQRLIPSKKGLKPVCLISFIERVVPTRKRHTINKRLEIPVMLWVKTAGKFR